MYSNHISIYSSPANGHKAEPEPAKNRLSASYSAPFLTQLINTQIRGLAQNPLAASDFYCDHQFAVSNDPVLFDQVV